MANEIRLEVYTFRIRKRRSKDFEKLDKCFRGDFFDFIRDYFTHHDKSVLINDELKKSFQIISNKLKLNSTQRIISGIIESGDYGIESDIKDLHDQKLKYKRQSTDLDVKPFYFLISIPKNKIEGYIVLQRTGIYGVTRIFMKSFIGFFESQNSDHKIEIDQYLSKELAQRMLSEGGIREITLKQNILPSDITDKLGLEKCEASKLKIEVRIIAKGKYAFPTNINRKAKKFINDKNAGFLKIEGLNHLGLNEDAKSRIKIRNGSSTRTIDMSDSGQIKPYYLIEEEVTKDTTGHPIFESIDSIAKSLIGEL